MGQVNILGQKPKGVDPIGDILSKYVYKGETINAGDLVEYINGVASQSSAISSPSIIQKQVYDHATACKLTENKVLIAYGDSSSAGYIRVANITGNQITLATALTHRNSSTVYEGAIQVDENHAIIFYKYGGSSGHYGILVNVSSSIPSILYTGSFGGSRGSPIKRHGYGWIGDGKFFHTCNYDNRYSTYYLTISQLSNDKTSFTTGTAVSGYYYTATAINASKLFCIESGNKACIGTIQGTTITLGNSYKSSLSSSGGACVAVNETKVLMGGKYNNINSYCICNIDSTSVSFGSIINSTALSTELIIKIDENKFFTGAGDQMMVFSLEGDTAIIGDHYVYPIDTSYTFSANQFGTTNLSKDKVFLFGGRSSSSDGYYRLGIVGVDNLTLSNNIKINTYEQQVTKTTGNTFNGIAKTSGTGGTSTAHNQQIEIIAPHVEVI